ncbi:unnamed protein product [Penicillium olsonii]|uniref:CFEM domain-containing protein n=1 Tax=Penicillium olsonii TaxID=99116 RepID=A0A9W4MN52_PENOL|nr:unnamed protein product [Penicillium olsonii]CAG8005351.1 unnamed protein product [Penicillium olsonii]
MKLTIFLPLTAFLSWAVADSADPREEASVCLVTCLDGAAATAGCHNSVDYECACPSTVFKDALATCMKNNCTADDITGMSLFPSTEFRLNFSLGPMDLPFLFWHMLIALVHIRSRWKDSRVPLRDTGAIKNCTYFIVYIMFNSLLDILSFSFSTTFCSLYLDMYQIRLGLTIHGWYAAQW